MLIITYLGGMDDFYDTQKDVLSELGYMDHDQGISFEIAGEQK